MKKQNRFWAAVLALSLCLALTLPAVAVSKDSSEAYVQSDEFYYVTFKSGIPYNSVTAKTNFSILADTLQQIVFTINVGNDIYTIGYYLGGDSYSYDIMEKAVIAALDDLNYSLKHDIRLLTENFAALEDLELKSVEFATETKSHKQIAVEDIERQLLGADSCILRIGSSISEHESTESIAQSKSKHTIDGSYHHTVVSDDGMAGTKYWYNQLNNTENICAASLTSPHEGDGNNRYNSGYQWFPNNVSVDFHTEVEPGVNRTELWYKYDDVTLANLNVDSNEALEMEVVFYNYQNAKNINDRGSSFQFHKNGSGIWVTNQPNSYLDTTFEDESDTVSFCVGVQSTSSLTSDRWYYWRIDGYSGSKSKNMPHDGRFAVYAQRSYASGKSISTWNVFAEEHEPILKLGVPNGYQWVPAEQNAWYYAEKGYAWTFDSSTDPVQ